MKVFAGANHALFLTDGGDLYRVEQEAAYLLAREVHSAAAGAAADIYVTKSGKVMKVFSKTRIKEMEIPDHHVIEHVYAAGDQNYILLFDKAGQVLEYGGEKTEVWAEKCVLAEVYGEETLQQVRKCSKVFMTGKIYYEYVDHIKSHERELAEELSQTTEFIEAVQEYGRENAKIELQKIASEALSGFGPTEEQELAVGECQVLRSAVSKITYIPRILVKSIQEHPSLIRVDFYEEYYKGCRLVKKSEEIPAWIRALHGIKKVILPSVDNYGYVVLLDNGELRLYLGEDQLWKIINGVQDVSDYPGTMIVALDNNEILYGNWKSITEEKAKRFRLNQEIQKAANEAEPEVRWILAGKRELELEPDILSPGGLWLREYHGTAEYVILPEGITRIGRKAFCGSHIKGIKINKECVEIEDEAFEGCDVLEVVEMEHTNVQTMRFRAFANCASLKSICFPKNCQELDMSVFSGCSGLEKVKMNIGLREIAIGTFEYCSSLQEVEVPMMCRAIRKDAFGECTALKKVICHEGLKSVDYHAFVGACDLEEVILPPTCTEVNMLAFEGCKKVKMIR